MDPQSQVVRQLPCKVNLNLFPDMSNQASCSLVVRKKLTVNIEATRILKTLSSFSFRNAAVVGASIRNAELVTHRRVPPVCRSSVRVIAQTSAASYLTNIDQCIEHLSDVLGWTCDEISPRMYSCVTPDLVRVKLLFQLDDAQDVTADDSEKVAIDYLSNASVGINSIAFVLSPRGEGRVYYTDKFMEDIDQQTITVLVPSHKILEKAERIRKKFPPAIALTFRVIRPLVVIRDNHFQ